MTESKDNEEHDWEDEVELHLMDVCPLFTTPDSCILPSGRIVTEALEF